MKVPLSWIREFVDVKAPAEAIGALMGLRGLPLESLDVHGDDVVLDFEVTANRPDCMSVAGIAREIATAYNLPMRADDRPENRPDDGSLTIAIEEPDLCGRYVGAVADVTVAESPKWMQDRLTMCGVRPISNIVDITNYVLLERGQPMHAFDAAKLRGGEIRVRRAKTGESIKTLDGKMRALTTEMLVIADAERAEAIGGVMGGADSEVTGTTKRIVFEAAWFRPSSVRATSKKLGLKTEASMRFERGMDLTAPARAMARACQLLEQIGAGKATGSVTDVYPAPYQPRTLRLDRRRIAGLLGMEVPDDAVRRILTSLGFGITTPSDSAAATSDRQAAGSEWNVIPPPWRVDMHRQVDLIEEVGRHHGFEHLPTTFPGVQQAPPPSDPRIARDRRARTVLLGMGFSEAITLAFIEGKAAEPFLNPSALLAPGGDGLVTLANPLSELFAVMRPSLLPGLIDALSHNRRHGRADVRLFEIGTRFSRNGETRGAGFGWTGLATPDHWSGSRRHVDFFDAKGVIEQLVAVYQVATGFAEADRPYLVPGRAAAIVVNGLEIGVFGQLAPSIAEARELPATDEIYVGEINLDALSAAAPAEAMRASALPRYPSAVRDISILVGDALSAETVRATIRTAAPETLIQAREFDRYQGKGIPDGKISLSFRLTFQSVDRTLTDEEVQAAMQRIIEALTRELQAVQR
jgi:phenylalanyl-tRNA synthetase beta chain